MTRRPRVIRNDWSSVRVPDLSTWTPTKSVSVVIPAYQCQESLDLTLASLADQTYPADLIEIVVVDDGSRPRLRLPPLRPAATRIVWVPDLSDIWGIANACNVGVQQSKGELILRLDADMVVFPDHIEAHARWHHQVGYAVTLGSKLFVDVRPDGLGWPAATDLQRIGVERLFDPDLAKPHEYVDRIIDRTDRLRAADHLGFLAHVGASVAVRRELYDAAGGYDTALRRGSDTEFGYRLAQVGAVFVPEAGARSWHLGMSGMMRDEVSLQRLSRPYLADRMPHPRWLRQVGGSGWSVPLITAVMEIAEHPLELVRAAADAVLRSDERDLRLHLVGPWNKLHDEPRRLLDDPLLDLRLIAATYRSDPRVSLSEHAPLTAFPSPYLLAVPATAAMSASTLRRLVDEADRHQAGLVRADVTPDPDGCTVTLWRTAALGRAGWLQDVPQPDPNATANDVAETFGARELTAAAAGIADLSGAALSTIARAGAGLVSPLRPATWMPQTVEVAGLRSWVRATALLVTLVPRRIWSLVHRLRRRP